MKVVLISIDAKYIHTNNAVRLLKANSSFDITILEYTIKDSIDQIVTDIESLQPDVIGCSVYIWNVSLFRIIIDRLRLEGSKLILGGPEVSYEPAFFLNKHPVDYVVRGEGEHTFESLLQHIDQGESPESIPGIAFKKDDDIVINPIQEITDLNTVKPPYFFPEDIPHIPNKISYIESSRGCPYNCSYCLSSLEEKVRFFPQKEVQKAILYLMEKGSRTIKFLDRTFNANRYAFELIDFIILHDNHKTVFQFEITGDVLRSDIVEHINQYARKGLFRFEIGIQSTNDETNTLVDRRQDTKRLFDRIKHIQDGDVIDLHLDLIAGLPRENKESFIKTFNDVYFLGAKELQLGFLKMLRGTKIRKQADLYNYKYNPDSPYEIISNDALSEEDIEEIKLVEHMLELYHNKGYFGDNLHKYILSLPSPYDFFLMIGKHYLEHEYSMHGYQITDVYKRLFEVIDQEISYSIIEDYLLRFKIKPQVFFPIVKDKKTRSKVYNEISKKHDIPIHLLYKHSILIKHNNVFVCALYQNNKCVLLKYN